MGRTWGRLYAGTRHHRKIRILRQRCPESWWIFYPLLEMAFEADDDGLIYVVPGMPYTHEELALEVGLRDSRLLQETLKVMEDLRLVSQENGFIRFLSYNDRQFKSDADAAERKRLSRERAAQKKCHSDVTTGLCDSHTRVTPPETETETETETEAEVRTRGASPDNVTPLRKRKGEAVGGRGTGKGEPHPQPSPEAHKLTQIFASPMPGGMDGDACTSSDPGLGGDESETTLSVCPNLESPDPERDEAGSAHKDSVLFAASGKKQRGAFAGGNGDARPKLRKVFGCEAFTITEDLHDELCRCFPLLPPEQILAEYEKIRDWCLDNRLTPRHRKKFTGAGQLREPRRFLKNWFRKEEPNPAFLRPLPSVREPPPEPEDILVPDPDCPVCRGGGLARDGPCHCLRLEREVLAMRGRDGQNPSESGTTTKPSGGSGSRAIGSGSNPSQAEQPA